MNVEDSSELNAALPVNSSIACDDVSGRRGGGGGGKDERRRGGRGRRRGGRGRRRGMRVGKEEVEEEEKGKRDHTFAYRYKTLSIQSHSQHTTTIHI